MRKIAADIARMWGTSLQFQDRRVSKVRKFFEELCEDERLLSIENERARMVNAAKMIDILQNKRIKNVKSGHSFKHCISIVL